MIAANTSAPDCGARHLYCDGAARLGWLAAAAVDEHGWFVARSAPGKNSAAAEAEAAVLALEAEPGVVVLHTDYCGTIFVLEGAAWGKPGRWAVQAERIRAAANGRTIEALYTPSHGANTPPGMRFADYVCRFAFVMQGLAGQADINASLLPAADLWPTTNPHKGAAPVLEIGERFALAVAVYLAQEGLYHERGAVTNTPYLDWRSGAVRLALTGRAARNTPA